MNDETYSEVAFVTDDEMPYGWKMPGHYVIRDNVAIRIEPLEIDNQLLRYLDSKIKDAIHQAIG